MLEQADVKIITILCHPMEKPSPWLPVSAKIHSQFTNVPALNQEEAMKINIIIETTAQEMRDFLGLPDVQPLQDEMLRVIRDNVQKGVAGFDALSLMKPLLPVPLPAMEALQKTFWDIFVQAGNQRDSSANPATDEAAPPS